MSGAQLDIVEPETSQAYDVGYRYQGDRMILSTQAWYNQFHNRIVRVFDQIEGLNISRNIGDVNLWGWEVEAGYQLTESLSAYGSAAFTDSEVQSDLPAIYTPPTPDVAYLVPTAGKQLVENAGMDVRRAPRIRERARSPWACRSSMSANGGSPTSMT